VARWTGAPITSVMPHAGGDLVAGHEPVAIGPVIRVAGQIRRPVGTHEPERVPPILPTAAEDLATVQGDVRAPGLLEVPAHEQARLAGPDDHRLGRSRQVAVHLASVVRETSIGHGILGGALVAVRVDAP